MPTIAELRLAFQTITKLMVNKTLLSADYVYLRETRRSLAELIIAFEAR